MLMRSISRPGSVGGSTLAVATITAVLAGLVGLATSVPAQADGVDGPGTVVPTFEAPVGSPPGFQGCTPDGALDPNRRGYPNAIALDGEKLVVAGNFCGFRGEPVARMVRLTTSGQIDRTFQLQSPLPTPPSKLAILPDGSYLVIGQPPISLTATHSVNRVSSGGAALPVSLTLNLSVVTDLLVAREGDGDYLYVASEARTGTVVAPGNAPYLTKYRYTRDGNFRSTNFCPEGASSVTPGSGGDADLRSCAVVQEPGVGYKALLADADAIFAAGGANFQHAPGSPIPSAESRIPGTDVCGRRFTAGVVKLFYRTGEALADFGSCDAADHQLLLNGREGGTILAMAQDTLRAGQIYIAGRFNKYGREFNARGQASSIMRLLPTGLPDPNFRPGFANGPGGAPTITDVVVEMSGKVILVGDFESFGGQLLYGIVRLNQNGSVDSTFMGSDAGLRGLITRFSNGTSNAPQAFAYPLSAVQVLDEDVFVAGNFDSVETTSPNRSVNVDGIALLNSDGATRRGTGLDVQAPVLVGASEPLVPTERYTFRMALQGAANARANERATSRSYTIGATNNEAQAEQCTARGDFQTETYALPMESVLPQVGIRLPAGDYRFFCVKQSLVTTESRNGTSAVSVFDVVTFEFTALAPDVNPGQAGDAFPTTSPVRVVADTVGVLPVAQDTISLRLIQIGEAQVRNPDSCTLIGGGAAVANEIGEATVEFLTPPVVGPGRWLCVRQQITSTLGRQTYTSPWSMIYQYQPSLQGSDLVADVPQARGAGSLRSLVQVTAGSTVTVTSKVRAGQIQPPMMSRNVRIGYAGNDGGVCKIDPPAGRVVSVVDSGYGASATEWQVTARPGQFLCMSQSLDNGLATSQSGTNYLLIIPPGEQPEEQNQVQELQAADADQRANQNGAGQDPGNNNAGNNAGGGRLVGNNVLLSPKPIVFGDPATGQVIASSPARSGVLLTAIVTGRLAPRDTVEARSIRLGYVAAVGDACPATEVIDVTFEGDTPFVLAPYVVGDRAGRFLCATQALTTADEGEVESPTSYLPVTAQVAPLIPGVGQLVGVDPAAAAAAAAAAQQQQGGGQLAAVNPPPANNPPAVIDPRAGGNAASGVPTQGNAAPAAGITDQDVLPVPRPGVIEAVNGPRASLSLRAAATVARGGTLAMNTNVVPKNRKGTVTYFVTRGKGAISRGNRNVTRNKVELVLGAQTVSKAGSANLTARVSRQLKPGAYLLVARYTAPDGGYVQVSRKLRVRPGPKKSARSITGAVKQSLVTVTINAGGSR